MSDSTRNDVLVIIPAYNEATVIRPIVEQISRGWNVVVIDDGSHDETSREAAAGGAVVLRHCVNRGQGASLQTGLEYAKRADYEVVVTFDADGQHRIEDIRALLSPIDAGRADVVLGSRFKMQVRVGPPPPLVRRLMLRGAILFTRLKTGMQLTDTHNGLRAMNRQAFERIRIRLDRMAHASELIDQIAEIGARVEEVPIVVAYSSYSLQKGQRNRDALKVLFEYVVGRLLR